MEGVISKNKAADHFAWDGLDIFAVLHGRKAHGQISSKADDSVQSRGVNGGSVTVMLFRWKKKQSKGKEHLESRRWMVKATAKVKLRLKVPAWCSGADHAPGPTHPWAPDFSLQISSFEGTSVRQFTCSCYCDLLCEHTLVTTIMQLIFIYSVSHSASLPIIY